METIQKFVFCVLFWPALTTLGQELLPSKVGTPAPRAPDNAVSPGATPSPAPDNAPTLIPAPLPSPSGGAPSPVGPELPDLSQLEQLFKQSNAGKEAAEYRAHIEWRQLKTRMIHDPAVVAAKATAEAASTDLEKRNRLRAYYETYYQRMRALASSPQMVEYLDTMKNAHLDALAQPRVRPTPEPAKKMEH
jgi:hypothetical protein